MKNIPTEPGNYWWEDTSGSAHTIEFESDMCANWCEDFSSHSLSPEDIEDEIEFKRWLGKAVPPKKVNDLIMSIKNELRGHMSSHNFLDSKSNIEELIEEFEKG